MGRAYAASLGCLALASCIMHGCAVSDLPEDILVRSISMLFIFAVIGWVVGQAAEWIVRQSLEMNYRARVERMRQESASAGLGRD